MRTLKCLLLLGIALTGFGINAEIIHSERSLYRNLQVEDQGDMRCLKFNTRVSDSQQSCMLKSDPNKLVFNYTKLLLSSLLVVEKPNNILIIGLGGGTMSNTLQQLFPEAKIDNVEIDPSVVKVARQYFGYFENQNIRTINQDGRIFIKRAGINKQQYDLIILDAYNGDYIPEHLLTKEFLEETKAVLSLTGVIAANTFSISKLYQYETATYHAVFGDIFNVKSNDYSNRVILAGHQLPSNEIITARSERWRNQLEKFDVELAIIRNYMEQLKATDSSAKILTDQYSPANLLKL